jgi:hypothetical protein
MHRFCPILLIASAVLVCGCWRSPDRAFDATAPLVDASTLKGTDFVAVRGAAIRPDRNCVYCATFQMVWDQLKEQAGGPLRYVERVPLAEHLNREKFDLKDISPDCYFLFCREWKPGIGQAIQSQRDAKFPTSSLPVAEIPGSPKGYVAYAYLYKLLKFALVFERHKEALAFHDSTHVTHVASFGGRGDESLAASRASELSAQVRVHSYASPDDFVISLYPKGYDDEIVLAKFPPGQTLEETIGLVQSRITNHALGFEEGTWNPKQEPLWIPLIGLNMHNRYRELEDKPFQAPQFSGPIVWTSQDLRFRLDETGALVESQAAGTTKSTTLMPLESRRQPRILLFDRPFLVMLRRIEAKTPYLAVWIGNADLLLPFE